MELKHKIVVYLLMFTINLFGNTSTGSHGNSAMFCGARNMYGVYNGPVILEIHDQYQDEFLKDNAVAHYQDNTSWLTIYDPSKTKIMDIIYTCYKSVDDMCHWIKRGAFGSTQLTNQYQTLNRFLYLRYNGTPGYTNVVANAVGNSNPSPVIMAMDSTKQNYQYSGLKSEYASNKWALCDINGTDPSDKALRLLLLDINPTKSGPYSPRDMAFFDPLGKMQFTPTSPTSTTFNPQEQFYIDVYGWTNNALAGNNSLMDIFNHKDFIVVGGLGTIWYHPSEIFYYVKTKQFFTFPILEGLNILARGTDF